MCATATAKYEEKRRKDEIYALLKGIIHKEFFFGKLHEELMCKILTFKYNSRFSYNIFF